MKKKRIVVFVNDGTIEDIICDGKNIEFLVVDFDRRTLDKSCLSLITKTGAFQDIAALADYFKWDAAVDSKRVKEIYEGHEFVYGEKDNVA